MPCLVAQLVARPIADPGVCEFDPGPTEANTSVEIDREIFSTVNLVLPLIQEEPLSVIKESMCTEYWLTA